MIATTFKYKGKSTVEGDGVSFMPDLLRQPTYFRGSIGQKLLFREAISALHKVVTNDQRYVPRNKDGYLEWRRQQDQKELDGVPQLMSILSISGIST